MTGVLQGGWGYVWAAYLVTALVVFGYAGTVWVRYHAERKRS